MPIPPNPSLEQLQHWLQAVITHPGGSQLPEFATLENIVPPTSKQSSADRVGVYAAAYYLRLVDCLREFFPCLRFAMGEDVFDDFALAYLQQHPSQSYTLHHLADKFADFLNETRDGRDGNPVLRSAETRWEDFFVDLAQLEHAIEFVFDAEGPEELSPLGRGQGEGLPAIALTPQSTLHLVPGFQLLAFRYPVSSYYTAWKHGQQPSLPAPGVQQLALFRRDYIVRRHELTSVQHDLLSALQAGESLEQSIARIAPRALAAGETEETLATNLRIWFEQWARAGFFLPGEQR